MQLCNYAILYFYVFILLCLHVSVFMYCLYSHYLLRIIKMLSWRWIHMYYEVIVHYISVCMYCCISVIVCWCIAVRMYCCIVVFACLCICVFICFRVCEFIYLCISVFMNTHICVICVFVYLNRCVSVFLNCCVSAFLCVQNCPLYQWGRGVSLYHQSKCTLWLRKRNH